MMHNNITRLLDSKKISYTIHSLPDKKLSAVDTAAFLNVSLDQVFKSIVLTRTNPGKPIIAIIPASCEANTKKIAKQVKEKKVAVTTLQQAEKLTGLMAGGISPLALINKGFEFLLDESALKLDRMYISGGQIGIIINLSISAFVDIIRPKMGDFSRFKNQADK